MATVYVDPVCVKDSIMTNANNSTQNQKHPILNPREKGNVITLSQ